MVGTQVRDSARTPLVSLLIEGAPGAGKTSLSAYLALQAEFPYIKFISAENLVNQSESARAFKLTQVSRPLFSASLPPSLAVPSGGLLFG